jgi:hypothetical protein
MPYETIGAKGRRYLTEGRLLVIEVGPAVVHATCPGDGAVHRLGWWRGCWGCSCPAGRFGRQCAHLAALRLVVTDPGEPLPFQANNPPHRPEVRA